MSQTNDDLDYMDSFVDEWGSKEDVAVWNRVKELVALGRAVRAMPANSDLQCYDGKWVAHRYSHTPWATDFADGDTPEAALAGLKDGVKEEEHE